MKLQDRFRRRIPADVVRGKEVVWINPKKIPMAQYRFAEVTERDVDDAAERLRRFAPLLAVLFPETAARGGLIESDLQEIPAMKSRFPDLGGGRLLLKRDSDLPVAGSVKARGGFYEVLKHSEDLALKHGLLSGVTDDYTKLASPEARAFFRRQKIQVGSTGNLGVSIGMMGAALGYEAIVHMSADAKQWKKDYLRAHGVTVLEYGGDYGAAVAAGRKQSDADPASYFVDDENSRDLFLGYAVAARRVAAQLRQQHIAVDEAHPLLVTIPCGVGGAPGGIAFGLKCIYGDDVHIFFAEPTQVCSMLLGLTTGLHNGICVQDAGLSGATHADGLAVGRPSGFVGRVIEPLLSGEVTVDDAMLYEYLRDLQQTEGIFIEPSACAAFRGPAAVGSPEFCAYAEQTGLADNLSQAAHIVWATGGMLVPNDVRMRFLETHL